MFLKSFQSYFVLIMILVFLNLYAQEDKDSNTIMINTTLGKILLADIFMVILPSILVVVFMVVFMWEKNPTLPIFEGFD